MDTIKSGIIKFLCKDCLSVFLGLILVALAVIFVAMTSVASQRWTTDAITDGETSHAGLHSQELLKKRSMETQELLRSRELGLLFDKM